MDNYNSGPVPPFSNNNSGYPPYYTPPTRHPGSGFAAASLVMGILSVLTAFLGTVFPPIVTAALAVLFALLSKGNDRVLLPNAKVGIVTAIGGFVVNILVVGSVIVLLFTNPDMKESFHDQLNRTYESLYGESFDDALDQLREGTGTF